MNIKREKNVFEATLPHTKCIKYRKNNISSDQNKKKKEKKEKRKSN